MKSGYAVEFSSDSRFPVDRKRVRQSIAQVLKGLGVEGPVAVSVRIVGDRKMRELNRKFRQEDRTTDVLSFATENINEKADRFVYPEAEPFPLGDVVISYPQARLQAAEREALVDEEIEILVEHGVKSLLGHHPA